MLKAAILAVITQLCVSIVHGQLTEAECHCFDEACTYHSDLKEWRCDSWTCDRGWTNAPFCNEACQPLFYGTNCEGVCHCPLGDTCSPINGLCSSGKCLEGYYGPSCRILLPRLEMPPALNSTQSCDGINIAWNRWNETADSGESAIHSYTVMYCNGTEVSTNCSDPASYVEVTTPLYILEPIDSSVKRLTYTLSGMRPLQTYSIKIRTNRLEDGKPIRGRSSESKDIMVCSPTTTPPPTTTPTSTSTTTTPLRPLPVTGMTSSCNSTSCVITWNLPEDTSPLTVSSLKLRYRHTRYLACGEDLSVPTTIAQDIAAITSYGINQLKPYSRYTVSVQVMYALPANGSSLASEETTLTFNTEDSAPVQFVSNTMIDNTGVDWVHVAWQEFQCELWNAASLLRYEVEIRRINDNGNFIKIYKETVTELNVTGLLPNVEYSAKVRVVTGKYTGGWSQDDRKRTQDTIPPAVASARVVQTTASSVAISITQPQTTVSITYYNITYQKIRIASCSQLSTGSNVTDGLISPAITEKNVTGLSTFTIYKFYITNVNSLGSTSYVMETRTGGTTPSGIVTQLGHSSNSTVLKYLWTGLPCSQWNDDILQYEIIVYKVNYVIANITTDNTFIQVSNPTPLTAYKAKVRPVNAYGTGIWTPLYEITTPVTSEPLPVTILSSVDTTSTSINISWTVPEGDSNIGTCPPVISPEIIYQLGETTSYQIGNLLPWSMYRITIEAVNDYGTSVASKSIQTEPALPVQIPIANHTEGERTLTFMWSKPNCSQLNGEFVRYEIETSSSGAPAIPPTSSVNKLDTTSISISVFPNVLYTIKLRVVNEVGPSPYSPDYKVQTINEVPKAVSIYTPTTTSNTATIRWSRQSGDLADDVQYSIRLERITLASCKVDNDTADIREITLAHPSTNITFSQLHPFSTYEVVITSQNEMGFVNKTTSFTTKQASPAQGVVNLEVTDTTEDTLSFSWQNPPCKDLTASIMGYKLLLTNDSNGQIVYLINSHKGDTWTAIHLVSYTRHTLTVTMLLADGSEGPSSPVSGLTSLSVPAPVSEKVTVTEKDDYLYINWTEPSNTRGSIEHWRLEYTSSGQSYNIVDIPPTINYVIIRDVKPYTDYTNIVVKSKNSAGYSLPSPSENYRTKPSIPTAPRELSVLITSLNCIELLWQLPDSANGLIEMYQVEFRMLQDAQGMVNSSAVTIVNITDTKILRHSLGCSLRKGAEYELSMSAFTQGAGEGPSSSITFWTRIGTPPNPKTPVVIGQSDDRIVLRLYSVISTVGPVSYYQIWIRSLSDVVIARKRRQTYTDKAEIIAELNVKDFTSGSYEFVIGDNRTTAGLYRNRPLAPSTRYEVYHVVVSQQSGVTETSYSIVNASTTAVPVQSSPAPFTSALSPGYIAALVLLPIVALICIALLIYYICKHCRRRRSAYRLEKDRMSQTEDWLTYLQNDQYSDQKMLTTKEPLAVYTGYWSLIASFSEKRHVIFEETVVGDTSNDTAYITFEQEFNNLPRGQQAPCTVAARHPEMNRVSHLVAYDHSRVVIKRSPLEVDYINASYIDGYYSKKAYIATTSPFSEESCIQLWQMVWEQNVTQIVMMTNMMDEGIVKCVQYWPEDVNRYIEFGQVTIETLYIDVFAYFTIYKLKLTHGGHINHTRTVTQFHFTGWPEHGVPRTTFPLLEFRQVINSRKASKTGPTVVHCGTGCSTTGFYIALDYLINEAENNNLEVSVFKAVSHLRADRIFMVRTLKQYLYLYDCLFEHILGGRKIISHDLKSKYKLLSQSNQETGMSQFKEEVSQLKKYTPQPRRDELSTAATLEVNRNKNRYSTVLPPDTHRVKLSLEHGVSDYINAVYIDRHRKRNAFILTQTPLPNTVIDFWRMIYEQRVRSIVMMDDGRLEDDSCAVYWPTNYDKMDVDLNITLASGEGYRTKVFGEFVVRLISEEKYEEICTCRHLLVTNKLQPNLEDLEVQQFQIIEWPLNQHKPPKTGLHLLKLIDVVEKWQSEVLTDRHQAPVVVHCLDGAGHSPLFIAAATICEKMACEDKVNIFLSVKEIKHRRPDALPDHAQYKYLHKLLWDFINIHLEGKRLNESQSPSRKNKNRAPSGGDFVDSQVSYESYNDDDRVETDSDVQDNDYM